MLEIGSKIRELRLSKKMTQKELAEMLNVTPQAVSKWERNLSYPDLDTLVKLSRVFDVSTDSILGESKKSFFEQLFGKGRKNMKQEKQSPVATQEKRNVKHIAFVLYADSGLSYMRLTFPLISGYKLEKAIHEVFDESYEVNFKWQSATLEDTDALIVPQPFAPFVNEKKIPIIEVPATLFITMEAKEMKAIVDTYFSEKG